MPVEIVQFCWEYNLDRLQKLPEAAGLEVQQPVFASCLILP